MRGTAVQVGRAAGVPKTFPKPFTVKGRPLTLKPTLARFIRVRREGAALMLIEGQEHGFAPGSVLHILEPDVSQEIYGRPSHEGASQSALLDEAATLFRRNCYLRGSQAGFVIL